MLVLWGAYNMHGEEQTDSVCGSARDSTYLLLAILALIYPFVVTF